MSKRQPKKAKPTNRGQIKAGPGKELSEDQLKGIAGGTAASSFFRSVDGLKTETEIVEFGDRNPAELVAPANSFPKR